MVMVLSVLVSALLVFLDCFVARGGVDSPNAGLMKMVGRRKREEDRCRYKLRAFRRCLNLRAEREFCVGFCVVKVLFLVFSVRALLLCPVALVFFSSSVSCGVRVPFVIFLVFVLVLLLNLFCRCEGSMTWVVVFLVVCCEPYIGLIDCDVIFGTRINEV